MFLGWFTVRENASDAPDIYMDHAFDTDRQFLIINTTGMLMPGIEYVVTISSFRGQLTKDRMGLFLNQYYWGDTDV